MTDDTVKLVAPVEGIQKPRAWFVYNLTHREPDAVWDVCWTEEDKAQYFAPHFKIVPVAHMVPAEEVKAPYKNHAMAAKYGGEDW